MKTTISTPNAPAAIGAYSQAVSAGDFLFLSGQIAIDPTSGELISGDAAAQTEQIFKNIEAILKAADCDFSNVVKTTVFLTDIADFAAMNAVYATKFQTLPPARSAVAVVALPKGAKVEIEVIALKN